MTLSRVEAGHSYGRYCAVGKSDTTRIGDDGGRLLQSASSSKLAVSDQENVVPSDDASGK